jgi:hypothetical protein
VPVKAVKKLTPAQKAAEKKRQVELEKKAKLAAEKRKVAAKERVPSPPPSTTSPRVVRKIRRIQESKENRKDLAQPIKVQESKKTGASDIDNDPPKDRIVLVVRDPYWLHASWEVTRKSVTRAKAAIAENWHSVKPMLRVLKVDEKSNNTADRIYADIEIHGGVRNWYISVDEPPSSFRVLLGYVTSDDNFYELARSNVALTPRPGSKEAIGEHWLDIARDADRIFALSGGYNAGRETDEMKAMFHDRLKRPIGTGAMNKFGSGAESGIRRNREFHFQLDAEMIVFGSTVVGAHLTLGDEPVKVETDGTFSIRVPLPDKRQVLPATASTRDGVEEQTIVIAVERNTKVMEAITNDNENEAD